METNFVTECGPFDISFSDITHLVVADFLIQSEDNIT